MGDRCSWTSPRVPSWRPPRRTSETGSTSPRERRLVTCRRRRCWCVRTAMWRGRRRRRSQGWTNFVASSRNGLKSRCPEAQSWLFEGCGRSIPHGANDLGVDGCCPRVDEGWSFAIGNTRFHELDDLIRGVCFVGVHAVAGGGSYDIQTGQVHSGNPRRLLPLAKFLEDSVFGVRCHHDGYRDVVVRRGPQRSDRVMHGTVAPLTPPR